VHSKPFARGSLLLIGLAWTVPFLQPHHRFPLAAFYNEWLAFGLGLAALLLLATRAAWREAELPAVALIPPALALLIGAQAALGRVPYPEQAVTATLYLLWASLLMVLGRVLYRKLGMTAVATALAGFLLGGGLLSVLAGLLQHYHFFPALDFLVTPKMSPRVYGNLGQPNHFAAYVTLALCSAAYLHGSGRLHTGWAAACAVLLLPALVLSGSRGPWIYLALVAALALLLFQARRDAGSRKLLIFSLCLIPGIVIAGFVVGQGGVAVPSTAADPGGQVTSAQRLFEAAAGLDPRAQLAAEAWRMFLSAPVLGAGFGQFAWHHFLYAAETGATAAPGIYNHAHNLVLHLMAETGAAGALLVTGAAAIWLLDLRGVKRDLEWWWVLALLGILGAHSMMEYPLWHSYFLGIAAVLLGLGARRVVRLRLAGFARVTVACLMLAGWFNLVSVLPYYRDFERLVFLPAARSSSPVNEQAFIEAISRIHREPLLTPYVELAVAYSVAVSEEKLLDKLDLVSRAARFAPVSHVIQRQVLLLALAGEREAALRRLDQLARAYPAGLDEFHAELVELARRRPDAFSPLLEWTAAKLAQARAPVNR
jgi:O-antigen ligase